MTENPLTPFFAGQGYFVLDGGLATELEARGYDLNDPLWSAKVLLEDPDAIREVHRAYLEAGADCISTATYQASLPGLLARGLDGTQSEELLRAAVDLAVVERDRFWSTHGDGHTDRLRPLVAASVGPYGAYLADGSEYSGVYGLSRAELRSFHEERWRILASSGADVMACETIPSSLETEVLCELGEEAAADADTEDTRLTWISFSCRDGERISDGTPLREVVAVCDVCDHIAAVGVNCTDPQYIESLIAEATKGTAKPILVYPNSGEAYNANTKIWSGPPADSWWKAPSSTVRAWQRSGAIGFGGCCRVGPAHIRELRSGLSA